ncbi:MAG: hypothetical protein ACI8S6_003655 [Myxococcota bacterium]|jgi:hypothetical protein
MSMSIPDFLQRALAGRGHQPGIFSGAEQRTLRRLLTDSTDRVADLSATVAAFREALQGPGLALDPSRRARINDFFDDVADAGWPLGLRRSPPGDWVDVLLAPAAPPHTIAITRQLTLRTDGQLATGDVVGPWSSALDALWAALWPLRSGDLPPEGLADALAAGLITAVVPAEGDGKLDVAATLLLGAVVLEHIRGALSEPVRAQLQQRVFDQPALTAARDRALGLLPPPESSSLLAAIDAALGGELTIDWRAHPLSEADARLAVSGLVFCRTGEGADNFLSAWPTFAGLHPEQARLDDDERSALRSGLLAYIEGTVTPAFMYGKWKAAAAGTVGQLRNAELTLPLQAALSAQPPRLAGLALTEAQAGWFSDNLGLIRDQAALWRFEGGVRGANAVSSDPGRLCGTGFALFVRVHRVLRNRADSSPDGLLDYADLSAELVAAAGPLDRSLRKRRAALPRLGGVRLPEATVSWVEELFSERLRSARSLDNLAEALGVWADGAESITAEAADAFRAFVEGYLATWPLVQVFDFNKLGRMAAAARAGDQQPLCRVNGAPVDPGRFHVLVGEAVRDGLRGVAFPQPWMPNRWGYRARQAVELVDLLAEQAWRGQGPLQTLHDEAPDGAQVSVIATTSDMAYNGLVFVVRPRAAAPQWYYLDSLGDLSLHHRTPEPGHRLFETAVDAEGRLDVHVAAELPLSPRAYPLMVPYTVGQSIDVERYDASSSEKQTVRERFETRYRVVRGTILGYTHGGRYRVRLTDGDDDEIEQTFSAQAIREMNNPHYVSEQDGEACTVRFRIGRDDRLAADLEHISALAAAHGLLDFPMSIDEVALAGRQKAFLRALSAYSNQTLRYPRTPPVDDADRHYARVLSSGTHSCGTFLRWERGVCRHMFIREHMGKQRAGIDERFASGAANTYGGDFRGLHIWGEVTLADDARLAFDNPEPTDTRFLSDPTWSDPYIALWDGAYGNDLRRTEMYRRTDRYSNLLIRGE